MGTSNLILKQALADASTTREVVLAPDALSALPALAERCAPRGRWLVVADDTTWSVAGETAQRELQSHGLATEFACVLPGAPRLKPTVAHAQHIAAQLIATGARPVAVGSGVINDLVKYAAELAAQPYVCVATAASMDGYAASGAALLQDGFKRTLVCRPPVAVLADPNQLAASPARMTAWGYGDLAGKVVAGADWVLADTLGVEAINPEPFALVQSNLSSWLASPERLAQQTPQALSALLEGLLVSGFAMQAHGNSRPASGSDHQFSHLWEMEGLMLDGEPAAHGACVGVGCVAMLALYEWLLAQPDDAWAAAVQLPDYDDERALALEISQTLSLPEVAVAATAEMKAKRAIGSRRERVARVARLLPVLRQRLPPHLLSAHQMQQQLRAVGAAAHPRDLGLTLQTLAADYRRARLIRRRYTLLDMLEDLGWLDRAVSDLFSPSGFWGRSDHLGDSP